MKDFLFSALMFFCGFLACALAVVAYCVCAISKMPRPVENDAEGSDFSLVGAKQDPEPEPTCSTCKMTADRCVACVGNNQYVAREDSHA